MGGGRKPAVSKAATLAKARWGYDVDALIKKFEDLSASLTSQVEALPEATYKSKFIDNVASYRRLLQEITANEAYSPEEIFKECVFIVQNLKEDFVVVKYGVDSVEFSRLMDRHAEDNEAWMEHEEWG